MIRNLYRPGIPADACPKAQRITRSFALSFGAGLLLLAASVGGAQETFPVVHNEPITIRILDGKDGHPLVHTHLSLVGGYNQSDLHLEMWHQETITDDKGNARVSNALANLPLLKIAVAKSHLCQSDSHTAFSVEQIRRDGFSTANVCGIATVVDAPGVFTVFVKTAPPKHGSPATSHPLHAAVPAPPAAPPSSAPAAAAPKLSAPAKAAPPPLTAPALVTPAPAPVPATRDPAAPTTAPVPDPDPQQPDPDHPGNLRTLAATPLATVA